MPRMTHPDLPGQPIEVHPKAVDVHGKSGWVLDEAVAAEATPAGRRKQAKPTTSSEVDTVDLGPDVAAGDADPVPASAGTHEE